MTFIYHKLCKRCGHELTSTTAGWRCYSCFEGRVIEPLPSYYLNGEPVYTNSLMQKEVAK